MLHPTQTYRPCPYRCGRGRRCAAWVPAERSAPARGPAPRRVKGPRREASRIKPTFSVRPNAAPKGISSGRIGTRTAARVRPRCGRTCLAHSLHTPGLQASPAFSPSGQNEFRHNVGPSPWSRSAGIKVARPRHWKFTPKEAVTPLMNRRFSTRHPGATLRFHKYAQKGIPR